MISNPDSMIDMYLDAGADILVFHIEASLHPHRTIQEIKKRGIRAGLAVNPGTSVNQIEDLIEDVDIINMMSVNPGFGGQKFINRSLSRISRVRELIDQKSSGCMIQVDGGIGSANCRDIVSAGANILVAGTAILWCKKIGKMRFNN